MAKVLRGFIFFVILVIVSCVVFVLISRVVLWGLSHQTFVGCCSSVTRKMMQPAN